MTNYKNTNDQAVSPVIGVIACNVGYGVCTIPYITCGETYGRDIT
jgi:hypothetical protein